MTTGDAGTASALDPKLEKWRLEVAVRRGDPDIVYLWIGTWAFVALVSTCPIALEIEGTGRWVLDVQSIPDFRPSFIKNAVTAFLSKGAVGVGYSAPRGYKYVSEHQLRKLIADAMDGVAGRVVQSWEGDEPGKEIVTVERSTKIPR